MPLNIDPKMIDALVQRQVAQEQMSQPQAAEEKHGPSTLAKIVYAAGGGADAGSTLYGLHTGRVHEANPLLTGLPKNLQVPVGAAMEVGGLALLDRILGKNHPKVMNAAMLALGGLHGGLALKNMKTISDAKSAPIMDARPPSPKDTIPSNLVQGPDGGWYDPNIFPNVGK